MPDNSSVILTTFSVKWGKMLTGLPTPSQVLGNPKMRFGSEKLLFNYNLHVSVV